MSRFGLAAVLGLAAFQPAIAQDAAALFGAREAIYSASLSPDGTKIAFLGPTAGKGVVLYTLDTKADKTPFTVLKTSGKPELVQGCFWVANDRLTCTIGGLQEYNGEIYGFFSVVALDAKGGNVKVLSKREGQNALYSDLRGGTIIDYVPSIDGAVMMMRDYVPEAKIGSLIEKRRQGMGVDQIDTRTLASKRIEPPRIDAVEYITDGRGNVRITGTAKTTAVGYDEGVTKYLYRPSGSRDWKTLAEHNYVTERGFNPYAVDPAKNVAYGFNVVDGRKALVSVPLDGSPLTETSLVARPDVDVDGLIRIGRERRVVGASFATEKRQSLYFDSELKKLAASLGKALPNQPLIEFVDSSQDESKLLIWAGGDTSPGTYYLYDKTAKKLQPVMPARPDIAGVALSSVKPISYPAGDGTMIPGYLTLPPGSDGRNLPAIVMPHGGPSARDEWGFDWLAQFYANQGFAVIQPNYRGSSGYGEAWFRKNGYQSWKIAIGDVNDAARWLVKSGVADPARLSIVGWSYGGYAALQGAVTDPALYKAVVAIAPVTDFESFKRDFRDFSSYRVSEQYIGSGPHIREGSPAQNVAKITAPVMLFHGTMDQNVRVSQSRLMAKKLKDAGKRVEYVEYPDLAHNLTDSAVRADMLRKSAAFLKAAGK